MKKQRKFLAMLLTLAMALGVSVSAFAAEGPGDMPGGPGGPGGGPGGPGGGVAVDYGATHLDALADKDSVTNADAVSMLMSLGLVNGSKSGEVYLFNASANLKRAEAAKMVAQAAVLGQLENTGVQVDPKGSATFEDVTDHWAKDYIAYCADNGIMNGENGKFDPAGTVTAAELVAMMEKAVGGSAETAVEGAVTRDDAAQIIADALVASGKVQYVTESQEGTIAITGDIVCAPAGKMVTLLVNGVESKIAKGTYENSKLVVTDALTTEKMGQIGSFGGGDKPEDYRFRAGAYITEAGVQDSKSVKDALTGAAFTEDGVSGINMKSTSDNFNSIIVDGKVNYTIKDSVFNIESESDGSQVNDFSGYGAVIGAYNGARVYLDNVEINTKGVARLSSFTDENAATVFENSKIKVMGGTLYDGYKNSANQATMVAPPWVLGITGNARGTNLEGNCSTTAVIKSDMKANQWGVVSTDAGSDMQLFMVDADLTLMGEGQNDPFSKNYGSGYGTYAIGSAQEYFYGTNFNVGTYATIITGGYVHCASSKDVPDLYPLSTDAAKHQFAGLEGAQAEATGFDTANPIKTGIQGSGRVTTINSDAFGFMSHGKAVIDITDGTVINTNNAVFVQRVGDALINVDGQSQLNTKDGILLQIMDNDDSLVGMGDMSVMAFNTAFHEDEGWHEGSLEEGVAGTAPVVFNASDVTLNGNLYNGSGNYNMPAGPGGNGGYTGIPMEINLGAGATLNGAVASTAVMHIDENGNQATDFTIDQYYYLCHLAHKNNFNGVNTASVTLTDGAVWNVTGESLIQKLTVGEGCTVNGDLYVDGVKTEIEAGKTYEGNLVLVKTGEQPSAPAGAPEGVPPEKPVDENGNPIAPPDKAPDGQQPPAGGPGPQA